MRNARYSQNGTVAGEGTNHKTVSLDVQSEQRQVLDGQMQEKLQVKVQQQQEKVQDAEQLAAALKQHQLDDAKQAAAKREAAMKTKALMAGQVRAYEIHF